MPPKVRTAQEIEQEREKILRCALDMIEHEGYDAVSMRKIGRKLNFSATKIYSYFHNKDEVYIAVAVESYRLFISVIHERLAGADSSMDKLKGLVEAFIYFSNNFASHYDIMFGRNTPKYKEYVGSELEGIAVEKWNAGYELFVLIKDTLEDHISACGESSDLDMNTITFNFLCTLHGTVSFFSNKLISEIHPDPDQYLQSTVQRIVDRFGETIL